MQRFSDTTSQRPSAHVFIGSSPEDFSYLHELNKHLEQYQRKYSMDIWDITQIRPGSIDHEEAVRALRVAKVAILLVSVNFFNTDLIVNSVLPPLLTAARQKRVTLLSAIVGSCAFEDSELALFQSVNAPSSPLKAMKQAEREALWERVAHQVVSLLTESSNGILPYQPADDDATLNIASSLLHCHSLKERASREQVLNHLPEDMVLVGEKIACMQENGQKHDATEMLRLIAACSPYPDGVEKLAYALYQVEHDSQPWKALDTLLRNVSARIVTYTRLRQLHEILVRSPLPDYLIKRAYKSSIPDGWEALSHYDVPDFVLVVIEDLAKIPPQTNGAIPLFAFAQRLSDAAQHDQQTALHDALRDWINERARDAGLTAEHLVQLRQTIKQPLSPTPSYLLLMLDEVSEGNFCVQAWLFDHENSIIHNAGIEASDEPLPLEHLPTLLDDLLATCEAYLLPEDMKYLTIELFLPQKRLSCPVDRWVTDPAVRFGAIGLYHQIVVRSLERARQQRLLSRWKARWNMARQMIHEEMLTHNTGNAIQMYHEDRDQTPAGLIATLQEAPIVCLVLTGVPQHDSTHTVSALNVALSAGVPILIWPREHTDHPQPLRDLLVTSLSTHSLSQLPALIKHLRIEAFKSENERHQGHHLTLLWDDPNRLPPPMMARQLAMPTRRGA